MLCLPCLRGGGGAAPGRVLLDGYGASRRVVLQEQISMAHCGAGKSLLSSPINSQCGETESVFITFACHAGLGPQTEKGLWQTGEMG